MGWNHQLVYHTWIVWVTSQPAFVEAIGTSAALSLRDEAEALREVESRGDVGVVEVNKNARDLPRARNGNI